MVDSHVEVMSLRVVDGTISPSSTKTTEFVETFCTVAEIVPLAVDMVSVSPWLHASSQLLTEFLEFWYACENGRTTPGYPSSTHCLFRNPVAENTGESSPANMYCLPSIGGTKSDRSPVISMLTGTSSTGTADTSGERPARSITETIMTAEEDALLFFRPISLNTPCCIQYPSVLRRILTSMEHRSYMSHAGRPRIRPVLLVFALMLSVCSSSLGSVAEDEKIEAEVVVIHEVAHDPGAFTQGLEMDGGRMFESTGLFGESTLREVDPDSGEVIRFSSLEASLFGEGIAVVGENIIMLTWQNQTALVFDKETFSVIHNLSYEGEGWGLCFDGSSLVMSNGSSSLSFRDPETFEIRRTVTVTDYSGNQVDMINELECVITPAGQSVFANVWQEDIILMIDPITGNIMEEYDVSELSSQNGDGHNDVLNGIAHKGSSEFWITGKNWTSMYLVELPMLSDMDEISCNTYCLIEGEILDNWHLLIFALACFIIFMISAPKERAGKESNNRHDEQPSTTPAKQRRGVVDNE
ncbi:MAG: hypothetical protein CMA68_01140 [Euryarchaeota archaeon]|nr:hypothetical protein [Euryarchaeota archaeon]